MTPEQTPDRQTIYALNLWCYEKHYMSFKETHAVSFDVGRLRDFYHTVDPEQSRPLVDASGHKDLHYDEEEHWVIEGIKLV